MLDYDEKGSNMLPFAYIVLKEVRFLFLGSVAKKMRNSQVLMQSKAIRMIYIEEKRSDEVSRAKRVRSKSQESAWLTVQ